MAGKKPATIAQYFSALPADRRDALQAVRQVISANLDSAFAEGMQYGMPAWFLPHSVYPDGYHCDRTQPLPFASIAAQKNHMAIYLFCVYTEKGGEERFRAEWLKTGKKLDMGKSCVRFKKLEDVPLDVLGKAIKRATAKKFVASYEASLAGRKTPARKAATKKAAKKRAASSKKATPTRKTTRKKATPTSKAPATRKKAAKKSTRAKKK